MPLAPSAVAPVAMHTHRDMRRVIAALQQKVYTLEIELARHEENAIFVTESMRCALPGAELFHALHAIVATERGRRMMTAALRPARGDDGMNNAAAATARKILEL